LPKITTELEQNDFFREDNLRYPSKDDTGRLKFGQR
jgi:hypothetical protein